MFNSLLILMPVIAAQTLGHVYSGVSITDVPKVEAIDHTRRNMDDAFEAMAPRNGSDRMRYWADIISRELAEKDASSARGFLLAAPEMLDRESVKELRAAADSERGGSRDERLANAALRKLPYDIGEKYEAISGISNVMDTISPDDVEAVDDAETPTDPNLIVAPAEEPAPSNRVSISIAQAENNSRFRLLGSYADLANNTERWLENDRVDPLVLKITAIGLIQTDSGDGLSGATLRAASILKSARRSRRMTEGFANHIERRINEALPDDALKAALENSLSGLLPTDVRVERVRQAYISAIDPRGMKRLENELDQIDRLGGLTSPAAAITLLEVVENGSDLRRVRLIAEAGGDRAVALVKQSGDGALRLADNGVRLTLRVVAQLMGLTAASLALIFLMLSTLRRNFRRRLKMEVI